ncbi:hypothetical protein TNCV_2795751 [Trichonephila clavipes]|nr:hypothetical protein TNCV_2795751 [Trichonephila clavipes]
MTEYWDASIESLRSTVVVGLTNKGLAQSSSELYIYSIHSSCKAVLSSDRVNGGGNRARTDFFKNTHKHPMIFRSVTGNITLDVPLYHILNTARRINRGVVILQHRKFCRKESLKHKVNSICENTCIIVVCNHFTQDNRDTNPHTQEDIAPHNSTEPPPCFTVGTRQST